jgi:pimeloyl-ACP methyl ester carboxylesterase
VSLFSVQADAIAHLLEHLGLGNSPVSVAGTSYGGFVAYHLARALGPSRVDKVVIASSDLLKGEADDQALLSRGNVGSVDELLLPKDVKNIRTAISLAMYQPPRFVPDFILCDMIQASLDFYFCFALFFGCLSTWPLLHHT